MGARHATSESIIPVEPCSPPPFEVRPVELVELKRDRPARIGFDFTIHFTFRKVIEQGQLLLKSKLMKFDGRNVFVFLDLWEGKPHNYSSTVGQLHPNASIGAVSENEVRGPLPK